MFDKKRYDKDRHLVERAVSMDLGVCCQKGCLREAAPMRTRCWEHLSLQRAYKRYKTELKRRRISG